MPFVSKSQQRAMHAKAGRGEISTATIHEYDEATKKKPGGFAGLPERKAAMRGLHAAMGQKK
jgi:hypothetical protein